MPALPARSVQYAVGFQPAADFYHTGTLKVFSVNAFDDCCLLGYNHQTLIFVLGVAEEAGAVDLDFSLLVAIL